MPEIITTCTRCQRQLRVPEELQGRLVKCPACEITFTVERADGSPAPVVSAPSLPAEQAAQGVDWGQLPQYPQGANWEAQERLRGLLRPPAIALIVVGVLGILACAFSMVNVLVNEGAVREQIVVFSRMLAAPGEAPPPVDVVISVVRIVYVVLASFSTIAVIGGIQMLRLKTYWLAVTGAIAGMLNFTCLCCLAGIPVGIWALVVLCRPGASALFQSPSPV